MRNDQIGAVMQESLEPSRGEAKVLETPKHKDKERVGRETQNGDCLVSWDAVVVSNKIWTCIERTSSRIVSVPRLKQLFGNCYLFFVNFPLASEAYITPHPLFGPTFHVRSDSVLASMSHKH